MSLIHCGCTSVLGSLVESRPIISNSVVCCAMVTHDSGTAGLVWWVRSSRSKLQHLGCKVCQSFPHQRYQFPVLHQCIMAQSGCLCSVREPLWTASCLSVHKQIGFCSSIQYMWVCQSLWTRLLQCWSSWSAIFGRNVTIFHIITSWERWFDPLRQVGTG